MEIVLEFVEIDVLLRKALDREGVTVPDEAKLLIRQNHKKGTLRLVYTTRDTSRPRKPRRP